MVAFSKDRFKYQNWINENPVTWQKRKKSSWSNKGRTPNNEGRAILIKSARLLRSIRIMGTTSNSVTIGSDVPYARVHNEGLRMRFVQNVKAFVRMHKANDQFSAQAGKEGARSTRVRFTKTASGTQHVKEHTRKMNYKMPERRYMGESRYLSMQINRLISAEINKTFIP